jgi:aryl-alcohol dehydrogenase-like predicted oxidoreductase
MSIGEAWKGFMGTMDKEQSFKLMDAFVEAGGNFIDTASNCMSFPSFVRFNHSTNSIRSE